MGVSPELKPDVKAAMRPITVLSPMLITMARAVPENTSNGKLKPKKYSFLPLALRHDLVSMSRKLKCTFNGIGGEESQVLCFKWIFISEFVAAALRF